MPQRLEKNRVRAGSTSWVQVVFVAAILIFAPGAHASSYLFYSQYFEPDPRSAALGGAGVALKGPTGRAWWNPAAVAMNEDGWGAGFAGQRLNPEWIPLTQRHLAASYTRAGRGLALQGASIAHGEKHSNPSLYRYDFYLRDRCVTVNAASQLPLHRPAAGAATRVAVGMGVNRLTSAFGDFQARYPDAVAWTLDLGSTAAFRLGLPGARDEAESEFLRPELYLGLRVRNLFNQKAHYDGEDEGFLAGRSVRVGGALSLERNPRGPLAINTGVAVTGDVEWDWTRGRHDAAYFGGLELTFLRVVKLRGGRTSNVPDGHVASSWGGGMDLPVGDRLRILVDAASVPPPTIGGPRTTQAELAVSGSL